MNTTIARLITGSMAAFGFLMPPITMQAQENQAAARIIYRRCAVDAQSWRDNFGQCRLTGTEDGRVPSGKALLIEHVAATCVGPGTKIEPYLGLERNYVPTDRASCGVMFHGRLLPAE